MTKLKVLDLFAGTRSISKVFEEKGHESYSIENDKRHENIDWYADILEVTPQDILIKFGKPDVIWASPPCTTYSIASRHHHRLADGTPITEYAKLSDRLVDHILYLIRELQPTYWFIENPRGKMNKHPSMVDLETRHLLSYCQYGDFRMKPTFIWTNHPEPNFKPMCKNGSPCHEPAPRGSKTGTQGLKNAIQRSIIPRELCLHIAEVCT